MWMTFILNQDWIYEFKETADRNPSQILSLSHTRAHTHTQKANKTTARRKKWSIKMKPRHFQSGNRSKTWRCSTSLLYTDSIFPATYINNVEESSRMNLDVDGGEASELDGNSGRMIGGRNRVVMTRTDRTWSSWKIIQRSAPSANLFASHSVWPVNCHRLLCCDVFQQFSPFLLFILPSPQFLSQKLEKRERERELDKLEGGKMHEFTFLSYSAFAFLDDGQMTGRIKNTQMPIALCRITINKCWCKWPVRCPP